jgi:hypothetical protein
MGKGQAPTPDELKFIYSLFSEGYSNADILKRYEELERHSKLGSLPFRYDIRFIRQRRKEYEAAREILKSRIEQQLDPTLAKARKDHIDEIRKVLCELREIVKTPKIADISPNIDDTFNIEVEVSDRGWNLLSDFKSDPLFECAKEHVPIQSLWKHFDAWQSGIHGYFDNFKELMGEINKDESILKWMDKYPTKEEREFIEPILKFISDKAIGKEPNIQPNPKTGKFEPYLLIESEGEGKFIRRTSKESREERIRVKKVQLVDPVICFRYLDSDSAKRLIQRFHKLMLLEQRTHKSLDKALISRSYAKERCRLCSLSSSD